MRLVAVALFMNVTHLNEIEIWIAVELARRFAVPNQLGHPKIIRARRREKFLHQRRHFERQLWVFAVAPRGANFGDITL